VNAQYLARTPAVFVDQYNGQRPHRTLDPAAPDGRPATEKWTGLQRLATGALTVSAGLAEGYERAGLTCVEFMHRTGSSRSATAAHVIAASSLDVPVTLS
jgi:hypothetical protein